MRVKSRRKREIAQKDVKNEKKKKIKDNTLLFIREEWSGGKGGESVTHTHTYIYCVSFSFESL